MNGRYDELHVRHPEAFADQAAGFWLAAGADPGKALRLAKMNREVRNTPRARRLLAQAVAAKASLSTTMTMLVHQTCGDNHMI